MTQETIEKMMKDKMPQLEALFQRKDSPVQIIHHGQGSVQILKDGQPWELTQAHIDGMMIYMNMLTIFDPNEYTKETKETTNEAGSRSSGPA